MSYRLLLDENVDHEAGERLGAQGHDVEYVERVADLGRGAPDSAVAQYSATTERAVVTHDDDFVGTSPDEYHAVLFFEDASVSASEVATIVDEMSAVYPFEQVDGLQKVGREWL
ncbi:MAG: DUF5615 family PIN-like protein [Haloferacaceae archaeon]